MPTHPRALPNDDLRQRIDDLTILVGEDILGTIDDYHVQLDFPLHEHCGAGSEHMKGRLRTLIQARLDSWLETYVEWRQHLAEEERRYRRYRANRDTRLGVAR